MSTATLDRPVAQRADVQAPTFGRLVNVELRKMTDTRAGFWMLAGLALVTVATVVITLITSGDHDLRTVLSNAVQPASLFLPVVGILLVSSEWSQRTAVVTFALVPQRERVLAAKFAAGLAVALIALLACRVLATIGVAIDQGSLSGDVWKLSIGQLGQDFLYIATAMVSGVAFGAVFLASAPAIVLYFLLPSVIAALATLSVFDGIGPWLDQSQAMEPFTTGFLSGTEWAHAAVSLLLWMVLPAVVGTWRVLRADMG